MMDGNVRFRFSARTTAEVMAQILRLANGAAFAGGLNPAQWSALRYLADAVPEARTVTAFAHYHATTSGTASQTVAALVRKGLVAGEQAAQSHAQAVVMTNDAQHVVGRFRLQHLGHARRGGR